jgi:hypothetical protein
VSLADRFHPRREPPGPLSLPSRERREPKPLKKVNKDRRAARNARDFGKQAAATRRMACCVCSRRPCDPHHYPTRAAGGRDSDAIPLCARCHRAAHDMGMETFQGRAGVSFDVVKADIQAAFKEHTCAAWAYVKADGSQECAICEAKVDDRETQV